MKKGWNGESQRHSIARKGIRTTKPKIKEISLQHKWDSVISFAGERLDMYEPYHDGLGVMYSYPSGMPGTIDLAVNIKNPIYQVYTEEEIDDMPPNRLNELVKKTTEFFNKEYPNMSFDSSHVKYEEYIHFSVSKDLTKNQINELQKIPVDKLNDKLGKYIEEFYVSSKMYSFASEWNMYYHGINSYKNYIGVE